MTKASVLLGALAALGVATAGGADAASDSLVITYRSGRIQTVPLEEAQDTVRNIGFIKGSAPGPEVKARGNLEGGEQAMPARGAAGEKKGGVTIRWADPID